MRARNRYFAADTATKTKPAPNAAAAALAGLLPRPDFPLQMNLVPQFADDGSAEVRVTLSVASAVAGKLDVLIPCVRMLDCSVEARGISKRYNNVAALKGVDLTAKSGEVHGVLGPNGAGKTTLLRILLRLVKPDAGTVRLLGADLNAAPALPDAVAGFVETPAFYPYLSARANLALLDRLDGQSRRDRRARVEAVLERTGLGSHAETVVGGYSSGMRQRLGLASVLLRRPRLVLLDEPTSAIDAAGARDVRAMMQELAGTGAAVVFSSHDLDTVEQVCSTISVIDRGAVIFSGAIDELRGIAPDDTHILRTSDDARALQMAATAGGVRVVPGKDGALLVCADDGTLDRYVIALGCGGVAVRHLERRARSLESLLLSLIES